MQALTNRAKEVSREPMTFMERLYLPNIVKGMAITFSHIFKKQPTIQYPEQKRNYSQIFRGEHFISVDANKTENCTQTKESVAAGYYRYMESQPVGFKNRYKVGDFRIHEAQV